MRRGVGHLISEIYCKTVNDGMKGSTNLGGMERKLDLYLHKKPSLRDRAISPRWVQKSDD